MMRVQVMRIEPIDTPSKPYWVSTMRGVAVNRYCITWMMMIDSPSVIRMLRSNSSGLQPRQQHLVEHQADQHDRQDRNGERGPVEQAHHRQGEGHGEGAQHQKLAVGEVDDLHDAEDQRQADGDQRIDQSERDAVQA